MQVGGPFTDKEALEKSSSDGLVKEEFIWQHRALILPSPSPDRPMSMSSMSKKWIESGEARREAMKKRRDKEEEWRDRGQKRQKLFIHFRNRPRQDFDCIIADPKNINSR